MRHEPTLLFHIFNQTDLRCVDVRHGEVNDDKLGRDLEREVRDDEGVVVEPRAVQDVGQADERDVHHLAGRVVERVAQAVDCLGALALHAPVERGRGAQHPAGAVLKKWGKQIWVL